MADKKLPPGDDWENAIAEWESNLGGIDSPKDAPVAPSAPNAARVAPSAAAVSSEVQIDAESESDAEVEAGRLPIESLQEFIVESVTAVASVQVVADSAEDEDDIEVQASDVTEDYVSSSARISPELLVEELPSRQVPRSRLPFRTAAPVWTSPAPPVPKPLDELAAHRAIELLDAERVSEHDSARASDLACAAANLAAESGDEEGALDRYEHAVSLKSDNLRAQRGLRRMLVKRGVIDRARTVLEREIDATPTFERSPLYVLASELALSQGAFAEAEAALGQAGEGLYPALLRLELEAARGASGLDALESVALNLTGADAALRAAFWVAAGRRAELLGAQESATPAFGPRACYEMAIESDPTAVAAVFGLLRLAWSEGGERSAPDVADAAARLGKLLDASSLALALSRDAARARLLSGDPAGARNDLEPALERDEPLAMRMAAEAAESEERFDEAARLLERIADLEKDPFSRGDARIRFAEHEERRGQTAVAKAAFLQAQTEAFDDPRPARGLERAQLASGDKESALERHQRAAESDPARVALEWTRAARLLAELGRRDEALARIKTALEGDPMFLPAVELAVDLCVEADHPAEAARVLNAAAEKWSHEEPLLSRALRSRAARLWANAAQPDASVEALRPILETAEDAGLDADFTRALERRILWNGDSTARERGLREEAESLERRESKIERARAAALWHFHGLERARAKDPSGAVDSQRRALAVDPRYAPAMSELLSALYATGLATEIPAARQIGRSAAQDKDRSDTAFLALKVGLAFLEDAQDEAEAARAFGMALTATPNWKPLEEPLEFIQRRSGDAAERVSALERELGSLSDPAACLAQLVQIGEQYERTLGQPERSLDWFRRAVKLAAFGSDLSKTLAGRAAHIGLGRALDAAGHAAELAERALANLKEDATSAERIAAYEQLAAVDLKLRNDKESARLSYGSILSLDPAHPFAARILERYYLSTEAYTDLAELYEKIALRQGPEVGFALHLERARLRGRALPEGVTQLQNDAAIAADHRLALEQNRRLRPAMRHLYARARMQGDEQEMVRMSEGLAQIYPAGSATRAILSTRAAETSIGAENGARGIETLKKVAAESPEHLPALILLGDLGLLNGDFATSADAFDKRARAHANAEAASASFLVAAALRQEKLDDSRGAGALYEAAILRQPKDNNPLAFERLDQILREAQDHAGLAKLFEQRISVETNIVRITDLRLELAALYRDALNDRDRAEGELSRILADQPAHPRALELLSELYFEGKLWAEAADILIRRVRTERSREGSKKIFSLLGQIYADHLPDSRRAQAAFQRVLQIDPDDVPSLERLAGLSTKEGDLASALKIVERICAVEKDPIRRFDWMRRQAKLQEGGLHDSQGALITLQKAEEQTPLHLPAIRELALYHQRHKDLRSLHFVCDRAAGRFRLIARKSPRDPSPYHALFEIFQLRNSADRAAQVAGVLAFLGAATDEERAALRQVNSMPVGGTFGEESLDDFIFDARVPAGLRHLFRRLNEVVAKRFHTDLKKLGLTSKDRLESSHGGNEIASQMGKDLGLGDVRLYPIAEGATELRLEATDPPSVLISQALIENAREQTLRFYLGRLLRLHSMGLLVPLQLGPKDLGVLVGGAIRLFVPEFRPVDVDVGQLDDESDRLKKLISRKQHSELLPLALESASASLEPEEVLAGLKDAADRAGLLAAGETQGALEALARLKEETALLKLLAFAISDEYAELRRLAGLTG